LSVRRGCSQFEEVGFWRGRTRVRRRDALYLIALGADGQLCLLARLPAAIAESEPARQLQTA
jgi:hypothetical protein